MATDNPRGRGRGGRSDANASPGASRSEAARRAAAAEARKRKVAERLARVDAKVDQKVARVDAKVDQKLARIDAKVEDKAARSDAKVTSKMGRAAEKIEQAAAKVDAALAREIEKHESLARKNAEKVEAMERFTNTIGALDIWTRIEPKGRRPRFTREEIAAAAIRIADEEGIDALSMRYLASELGAGTMTLYHYVRTKDELMTLVTDAVMGEVILPPGERLPDGWRDAMTVVAHRSRDAMERHPWIFDINDDPPLGPNSVRHFDETLQAVSSLDISLVERLRIASLVDEYVFGHCISHRNNSGTDPDLFPVEFREYVETLLATGDYPQIQAIADDLGIDQAWEQIGASQRDPGRFDQGLSLVLDGIQVWLDGLTGT